MYYIILYCIVELWRVRVLKLTSMCSPDTAVVTAAELHSWLLRCLAGRCTEPSARPCGLPPGGSKTPDSSASPWPPNSPLHSQLQPNQGRKTQMLHMHTRNTSILVWQICFYLENCFLEQSGRVVVQVVYLSYAQQKMTMTILSLGLPPILLIKYVLKIKRRSHK